MHKKDIPRYLYIAASMLCVSLAYAAGAKVGLAIGVEGDGVFWNPTVTRIRVTEVEKLSLAESAGILAGDEVLQVEGQPVVGKRANELKAFLKFNAGETRTLLLKHANGEHFEARITKPAESPH